VEVEVEAGQVPVVRGQVLAAQEQVLAAQTLLPAHILIRSHFTPTAWGRRKRSTRARRFISNERFDFKVALQLGAGATAAFSFLSPAPKGPERIDSAWR
jgi:hypothetical protein